jgi:outer membrane receptor protein involved in Fe transport
LLGGNPTLQPETADTVSFGFVFRPDFANLVVAIDYFDIEIEETISSVLGGNADVYMNQCIATGNPTFCNLIVRQQPSGSLWRDPAGYITDTSLNLGGLTTSGIDIQANYSVDIGEHRLGFNLVGTMLDDLSTAPLPDNDFYDCAGYYGTICGVPAPEWRHSLRADWRTPWAGLDLSLTWRYFDAVDLDRASTDSQLIRDLDPDGPAGPLLPDGVPDPQPTDAELSAMDFIDLTAAMTFADQYTLRIGANNVLDEEPPLTGQANCPAGPCNGNTWPQVYDSLGRQYFMTLTIDF